jgi:hypothetical protein
VRKKLVATVALGAIVALAVTALAFGGADKSYKLSARLKATREVLRPDAPAGAKGGFAGIYVKNARGATLLWTLSFSGPSGSAAAAQIRKGTPGTAGAVVVPLCGPCTSGQAGSAILSNAVISALDSGDAYVNVRIAKNAAGEIRGQVNVAD